MTKKVSAIPEGSHSILPYLNIKNADKAIEFYKKAFGAKEIGRLLTPNGAIGHAELEIEGSRIMLAEEMLEWGNKGPETLGGSPVAICIYASNVDEVYKRVIAEGAKVVGHMEPNDQFYGDRSATILDPFGHKWTISTHIEDVSFEEMQKRFDKMFTKPE